jgi:hypothetical protein
VITNAGRSPGPPTILTQGALAAQLAQLEGKCGGQSSGGGGRNADQGAESSGFSGKKFRTAWGLRLWLQPPRPEPDQHGGYRHHQRKCRACVAAAAIASAAAVAAAADWSGPYDWPGVRSAARPFPWSAGRSFAWVVVLSTATAAADPPPLPWRDACGWSG